MAALVLTLMLAAIAAAVVLPFVYSGNRAQDATRTAAMLNSIALSAYKTASDAGTTNTGFSQGVNNKPPGKPSQLVIPITTSDRGCNGNTFAGADVTKWNTNAPFSGQPIIQGSGLLTPMGWIHDSLVRISATVGEMHIDSMTDADVRLLDVAVDGTADSTATNLLWVDATGMGAASGFHLAKFRFVWAGC